MTSSPIRSFLLASLLCLLTAIPSLQADSKLFIHTVPVADVGNPGDSSNLTFFGSGTNALQIGTAKEAFHIATYDTTASQYVAFLNAVAKDDLNHLYDERMSTDTNVATIIRKGSSGNYTYALKSSLMEAGQLPIVYVSWFSSARFCNWLHNNQPTGKQDNTTTEKGAYDLTAPVIIKHPQYYCDFLNAIAKNDPHQLYENTITSLIARQNDAGNYVYTLTELGKQKGAILKVTWACAARFANWKKNSAAKASSNETPTAPVNLDELTEKGLYTISEGIRDLVGDADIQPTNYSKIAEGAQFFLPTESQYYKAAFYKRNHDANNQLTDEYWTYPTQSDTVPGNDRHSPNAVNYYIATNPDNSKTGWFDRSDYRFGNLGRAPFITPVGAYANAPSPYGAYDMGGNVSQWLTPADGAPSAVRPIRGGGWGNENQWPTGPDQLSKDSGAANIDAAVKRDYIGFRIATP
ncbi:MAG: formylglycine-generating enzyme family protein [Chthoniobacterales bacterium]|nr:formylglycine-generating enzyme family protein [Chthoniobacterales bacterium]